MSDDGKKKNPWGNVNNGAGRVTPIRGGRKKSGGGGGRGSGGGGEPPDLDDMLRRAQDNFNNVIPGDGGNSSIIGLIIIGLALFWLSSGFYVVNPGEHAVIQRFGEWTRTQADPGLGYHFPSPIEQATVINVEELRKMNIGFVEAISRSGLESRRELPEESLMLTADRNIVDLNLSIQWNIKSSEDYLFNIRDQENTIKKVVESAVREVVGQTDMFPIITTGRDAVIDRTYKIIQENLDEYKSGVNIANVLIEKAEVHPDVQSAFQDVQSAKQDAEDKQNTAEAYREDILPKARGQAFQMLQEAQAYKESTIAKSTGDAERFNAVYEAYLSGKDVTKQRIYIETMESVFKNAQKIIMDNDGGQGVVPYLPLNEMTNKRKSGR